MLSHNAEHQGVVRRKRLQAGRMPIRPARQGRAPHSLPSSARRSRGQDHGMVGMIPDTKARELFGANIVGAEAAAVNLETVEEEIMHAIFPHPTDCERKRGSGARCVRTGGEGFVSLPPVPRSCGHSDRPSRERDDRISEADANRPSWRDRIGSEVAARKILERVSSRETRSSY